MATVSQITANHANAQRSTGPQSDSGKAVVSRNALKHGLNSPFTVLPHEDQSEFEALLRNYQDDFQPNGYHQYFLVSQMAQARWQLARAQRLEICAFEHLMGLETDSPDGVIVAAMLKRSADPIAALQRYAANAERSYHKAHREFQTAVKEDKQSGADSMEALLESISAAPGTLYPILEPILDETGVPAVPTGLAEPSYENGFVPENLFNLTE